MCYTKNQAETETEEKVKNAHSLDYTPPRIRLLRGDDGGKVRHRPRTSARNNSVGRHTILLGERFSILQAPTNHWWE